MSVQAEVKALRPKISFHISVKDRNEFHAACELDGTRMTYELIKFIKSYVHERRERLQHLRDDISGKGL